MYKIFCCDATFFIDRRFFSVYVNRLLSLKDAMQRSVVNRCLRGSTLPAPAQPEYETHPNLGLYAALRTEPVSEYLNSKTKRSFDISAALILLLLVVPALFLLLLLIRVSSPGPSLFKQLRYGKDRERFFILKFRSMYHSKAVSDRVEQAQRNDARVTPVGRLIRRTSLDELPQLINVLKGDMSLIGPRPHALVHDNHFADLIAGYEYRFLAKPGITGLAQVSGSRGATPTVSDMKRRVDLDIRYIQRASFILDLKILLRTIGEVLVSEAAF